MAGIVAVSRDVGTAGLRLLRQGLLKSKPDGLLQQAYSAFMKQGYNGEAPYPKTVPSTLPRKNLTLNGKEKMDCGNTENAQPETFEWSFKLRRKNPNHINMEYQSLDCASGAHTDTEFNRNGKTVKIIHKVYSS